MDNYLAGLMDQAISQAQAAANATSKKKQTPEEIARSAKQFEAMFIGQMLNLLFEDVTADPLFGDQASDKIYRSMLLDEYGKEMAEGRSMGIADHVQAELLKLQEI